MIGRGSVTDRLVARSLALLALSSIAMLASITFFIFREGAPLVHKVGLRNFFSGDWHPTAGAYGISLMIVGSAAVTAGALAFAVPLGLACAIVLAEMAPAARPPDPQARDRDPRRHPVGGLRLHGDRHRAALDPPAPRGARARRSWRRR